MEGNYWILMGMETLIYWSMIQAVFSTEISWLENTGDASFGSTNIMEIDESEETFDLVANYFNEDNFIDLIFSGVASLDEFMMPFCPNDGNGNFSYERKTLSDGFLLNKGGTQIADINGDEYPDVAISCSNWSGWILNQEEGFDPLPFYLKDTWHEGMQFVDMDNDGDMDLLQFDNDGGWNEINFKLHINNGSGSFADPLLLFTSEIESSLVVKVADVDNDSDMDILFSSAAYYGGVPHFNYYENSGDFNYTGDYNY